MNDYTYADCLRNAYAVNWRIEDVLGDRSFDPARPWLPTAMSASERLPGLSPDDRRRLTQVEMAAYAHLFGYVEEFIAPHMLSLAGDFALERKDAFDALANFAAEEVKHMTLFREVRRRVDAALGFGTALVGGREETARYVLASERGAVLLLTSALEWMSQRHFREAIRDDAGLDPLTRDVFRAHWLEESQHAKVDHLETLRAFEGMGEARRERVMDDLCGLVAALDGLLVEQSELDVRNFETLRGGALAPEERGRVRTEVLRAKRRTLLGSGVTHPRFQELFAQVSTEAQRARVGAVIEGILGDGGAAPAGARTGEAAAA